MEGHKEVVELLIDKYNLSATEKGHVSLGCFFVVDLINCCVCGSLIEWKHCCGLCSVVWSPSCAATDGWEVWMQCGRENKGR